MAAGSTYTPIATTTLGSNSASISFSSISGSYTDLRLIFIGGVVTNGDVYKMTVNSDTGTNYSQTELWGDGASVSSGRRTSVAYFVCGGSRIGAIESLTDMFNIDLQNYSNSTTYKTILMRQGQASVGTVAAVGLWRSTSAISSIQISYANGNILAGTTATLYGITAA